MSDRNEQSHQLPDGNSAHISASGKVRAAIDTDLVGRR